MNLKKILLTCGIALMLKASLFAISANEIKPVMTDRIDKTIVLIKAKKLSKNELENKIYATFDPLFDYKLMSRLSLGNQFKKLSPKQQDIFAKRFERKQKMAFSDNLKSYTDEIVKVENLKDVKKRKILETKIISSGKVYEIDYKFYDAKQRGWLIYDVSIAGVSIVQSNRNQFKNILDKHSFEELLDLLDKTKTNYKK